VPVGWCCPSVESVNWTQLMAAASIPESPGRQDAVRRCQEGRESRRRVLAVAALAKQEERLERLAKAKPKRSRRRPVIG
jgi:hypothetical protein